MPAFRSADDSDSDMPILGSDSNSDSDSDGDSSASESPYEEDEDVLMPNEFARYTGPEPTEEKEAEIKPMSEMEAVLYMLDLMACHKTTDELGKSVWDILRTALGDQGLATFNSVKNLLKTFQDKHVETVDICVNDCMPFYDCPEAKGWEPCLTAHLSVCEICNEDRWIVDPKTGKRRARKVTTMPNKAS